MYFLRAWLSDLWIWCLKHPVVGLVLVPVAIGVMLWSPWEEIAPSGMLEALPPECVPESMISFTFDDGYESTYTKAFPILKKYGFVATVYVVTNDIGKPGYMTKEQLQELGRNGWWIGSETLSHPHLTELTPQESWQELEQSKKILESWGFEVVDFATPFGDYDDRIMAQIQELYLTHRTTSPGLNTKPIDRYQLKALEVRYDTPVEEVFNWILRAKEEKAWLIIGFHRIDEEGEMSYKSEDLERIVKFVKEQGFKGVCPFANLREE